MQPKRNKLARIGSFLKKFFISVAGIAILSGTTWFVVKAYTLPTTQTYTKVATTTPQTLDQRWNANFEKDVELEMQRQGFKDEIAAYARMVAENNVKQAYITEIQKHIK